MLKSFHPSVHCCPTRHRQCRHSNRLHEIKTRALTIGAKYDEMDPDDMVKMAKMMPNATSFICPSGSLLCMWDDQQAYFRGLIPFLKSL
jgi:proline iminopeptidase